MTLIIIGVILKENFSSKWKGLTAISIDLPQECFKLSSVKNDNQIEHVVNKDNSYFSLNGKTEFTEEEAKTYNLSDTRTKFMRNYFTFLYGL
ncbi:MAG: hypothetical protein ACI9WT_000828, partial [Flavobacterium sp.]